MMFSPTSFRVPCICRICNQYHRNHHAICASGIDLFELLGPACHSCAAPLSQQNPAICGTCILHPPSIDRVFTAYRFSEPLRTLLHAFKYEGALYLTSLLSQVLMASIETKELPECFIPIPMHSKRIQSRGFNQAAILAQEVSKALKKPCVLEGCLKIKSTKPQAGLDAQERMTNLMDAFQASVLPYSHIALVDDLFTTGATANAVARALKEHAGVSRVDIWCCARTCLLARYQHTLTSANPVSLHTR